jgi:dihydrolipoamide dehydrogenase
MEANVAVNDMFGRHVNTRYHTLPACVYTRPELAWCGRTEQALQEEGVGVRSYKFHFHSQMRDPLEDTLDGFIKVTTDRATGQILGMSAIGETAGDMMGEGVMALVTGSTIGQWGFVPHVHPYFKSFNTMYNLGVYESSNP